MRIDSITRKHDIYMVLGKDLTGDVHIGDYPVSLLYSSPDVLIIKPDPRTAPGKAELKIGPLSSFVEIPPHLITHCGFMGVVLKGERETTLIPWDYVRNFPRYDMKQTLNMLTPKIKDSSVPCTLRKVPLHNLGLAKDLYTFSPERNSISAMISGDILVEKAEYIAAEMGQSVLSGLFVDRNDVTETQSYNDADLKAYRITGTLNNKEIFIRERPADYITGMCNFLRTCKDGEPVDAVILEAEIPEDAKGDIRLYVEVEFE
jgi:hypothetical protein